MAAAFGQSQKLPSRYKPLICRNGEENETFSSTYFLDRRLLRDADGDGSVVVAMEILLVLPVRVIPGPVSDSPTGVNNGFRF
jgi:hypothetical protein